jgi:tight adherence protein C
MAIVLVSFIAGFLLVASCGLLIFYRDAMLQRLSSVMGGQVERKGALARLKANPVASVETLVTPFERVLPRTPKEASIIQKRLIRAGYRDAALVKAFYGAKVVVPILLTLVATVTGIYQYGAFFVYAIAIGLGFLLPDFWLGNRIANRQLNIRLGLPEALDLMVICAEAGLGLDQSMMKVAQEMRVSQPEISDEFALVNLEQKAGRPRADALKNLAERTDVDTVRSLVNTLIQADTFGTSIAKTLRVYSDTLRTQRRQKVEEEAAKTTVKLVFPLVFFIFPALFVVALGPAMIVMFESFGKYFGT